MNFSFAYFKNVHDYVIVVVSINNKNDNNIKKKVNVK